MKVLLSYMSNKRGFKDEDDDKAKNRFLSLFVYICVFQMILFSSCGYRWGRGEIGETYSSIAVPYVEGDDSGCLTAAIIQRISSTGTLAYSSCDGDLLLKVCLQEPIDETIGFVYAPEENGGISKIVVSNESRLSLAAEVSLIERCSGRYLWGPISICSSLSYDFEPDLSHSNVHTFSISQLEMHSLAQDEAFPPLFDILAEKIVDYVNHSW